MKRSSIIFLQVVIVLIGIGALTLLLWEPHVEGANAHATTLHDLYFDDPFLAYIYVGSAPFFVALYQTFTLLGRIGKNNMLSQASVKSLRTIKYCAVTTITFLLGGEGYLNVVQRKVEEDVAGGVMMGLVMIFIALVIAIATTMLEKTVQNTVELKSK